MTHMLVAYDPTCGCRVSALLDPSDTEQAEEFKAEAFDLGLVVKDEEHDAIGAAPCDKHRTSPRESGA